MSTKMAVSQPWTLWFKRKTTYVRADTSGKETHLRYVVKAATSGERDPPQIGSWGNSTLASRGAKIFIKKTQKGGVYHFEGITEADSRPLLRQPSCTHRSAAPCHADLPWHWLMGALPCWTEDFICLAAHLAPEILPCKMLTTPVPTVLSPGPADWDSGTRVRYFPLIAVCVLHFS